jgi:hypothetical protein
MARFSIRCLIATLALVAGAAQAQAPATVRVDYLHSGNALSDQYALERVLIEPLPWPGDLSQNFDNTNRGQNRVEVADAKTGDLLYSRDFSTIFGEWRTTDEANRLSRGFHESVRFPKQDRPVRVRILKRDERNAFSVVWSVDVDADAPDVVKKQAPAPAKPIPIRVSGPSPQKVDLLIIGDGYTQAEMKKFEADARRLSQHLFAVSPFRERAADFNVWALAVPTVESGVSRPSTGVHHASPLGTRYDIFGSERYVLTLDNRALRDIAQHAPYEFIEILVTTTPTAAAGSSASSAPRRPATTGPTTCSCTNSGTTSRASPTSTTPRRCPISRARTGWSRGSRTSPRCATPWPKAEYEESSRAYQKRRAELRAANRPESAMNALFREDLARTNALFSKAPQRHAIGAFEGANYEASGYYRPAMQCIMFDRSDKFCPVCQDGISDIIDLYAHRQ